MIYNCRHPLRPHRFSIDLSSFDNMFFNRARGAIIVTKINQFNHVVWLQHCWCAYPRFHNRPSIWYLANKTKYWTQMRPTQGNTAMHSSLQQYWREPFLKHRVQFVFNQNIGPARQQSFYFGHKQYESSIESSITNKYLTSLHQMNHRSELHLIQSVKQPNNTEELTHHRLPTWFMCHIDIRRLYTKLTRQTTSTPNSKLICA